MRKIIAILLLAALLLWGCGEEKAEAEQTTVKGMVISVDGTQVEVMSTDGMSMGRRPSRGEGDGESDYTRPQGGNRPEGDFTMPEGFEGFGGNRFSSEDMDTTTYDLKDAHISVEIDGGKASGTMEDITVGSQLTITMEGDKVVNVLVSQSSFGNFGDFGGNMPNFGGNRGKRPGKEQQAAENPA